MQNKGHVYLIDDDASIRDAITRTLKEFNFSVEAYYRPHDLLKVAQFHSPAVIVTDMRMPKISGEGLQVKLKERGVDVPLIVISGDCQAQEIINSFKLGATDFLLKPFSIEELLASIQKALKLCSTHQANLSQNKSALERFSTLSAREREVCELLVRGLKTHEIAKELGISEATLKIHKSRVYKKMQTKSIVELVRLTDRIQVKQLTNIS